MKHHVIQYTVFKHIMIFLQRTKKFKLTYGVILNEGTQRLTGYYTADNAKSKINLNQEILNR